MHVPCLARIYTAEQVLFPKHSVRKYVIVSGLLHAYHKVHPGVFQFGVRMNLAGTFQVVIW